MADWQCHLLTDVRAYYQLFVTVFTEMAIFKLWDVTRQKKKIVIGTSLAKMLAKGYTHILLLTCFSFANLCNEVVSKFSSVCICILFKALDIKTRNEKYIFTQCNFYCMLLLVTVLLQVIFMPVYVIEYSNFVLFF